MPKFKELSSRYLIPFLGLLAAFLSLVYGVYMPFRKSSLYIQAMANLQQAKTLIDVLRGYDRVFEFSSPIGGEEIAKFTVYDMVNMVSNPRQPEQVARDLVNYIEPRMQQENVRHLLALAQLHGVLWQRFGSNDDYARAEEYYRKAFAIGPKLPPVLFGLLQLYVAKGETAKANEIGDRIVALWPDAPGVGEQLQARTQEAATSSK